MAVGRKPARFYLLTYQRTCSNLMKRLLSAQPALYDPDSEDAGTGTGYFFLPVVLSDDLNAILKKSPSERDAGEIERLACGRKECFATLESFLEEAEASGKNVLVKEHIHFMLDDSIRDSISTTGNVGEERQPFVLPTSEETEGSEERRAPSNVTFLSDEFLQGWRPIFLIRHPAKSIASQVRADMGDSRSLEAFERGLGLQKALNDLKISVTPHLTRKMYDHFVARTSIKPLIIDADDIINAESGTLERLCTEIGLDPEHIKRSWAPASEDKKASMKDDFQRRMTQSLDNSTTIMQEKSAKGISLEKEANKWKEEFGEELAAGLARLTRDVMDDYEYLIARKI